MVTPGPWGLSFSMARLFTGIEASGIHSTTQVIWTFFLATKQHELPSAALQAATKSHCATCYACSSISSLSLLTRLRSILWTLAERWGQNDQKRLSLRFMVLPSSFCHFPGQGFCDQEFRKAIPLRPFHLPVRYFPVAPASISSSSHLEIFAGQQEINR